MSWGRVSLREGLAARPGRAAGQAGGLSPLPLLGLRLKLPMFPGLQAVLRLQAVLVTVAERARMLLSIRACSAEFWGPGQRGWRGRLRLVPDWPGLKAPAPGGRVVHTRSCHHRLLLYARRSCQRHSGGGGRMGRRGRGEPCTPAPTGNAPEHSSTMPCILRKTGPGRGSPRGPQTAPRTGLVPVSVYI